MPFEAANKIEEVARDPEKVAPQSGAYLVAATRRRDRCNLCWGFFPTPPNESLFSMRCQ